jgi:hypothetical protein
MGDTLDITFATVAGIIIIGLIISAVLVCRLEAKHLQAQEEVRHGEENTNHGKHVQWRHGKCVEKSKHFQKLKLTIPHHHRPLPPQNLTFLRILCHHWTCSKIFRT